MTRPALARAILSALDLAKLGEAIAKLDDAEVRAAWARLLARLGAIKHERGGRW